MSSFSFEHKSTKYSSNCSVYLDDGDLSKYLRSDKSFDNSYFLNSQNTALSSEENCSENSLSFMTQTELESEVFFPQARQDYFFDGVLPKVEVPSPPVPRKPTNLINLPSKILDRIAQYISQEDAINLATTCFKLLEPCRKRIFKKLVFANSEEEVKILKKEKHRYIITRQTKRSNNY
ncbi:hypothetical protein PACTADRAFT_3911 [Pachysolen tannophilus NRRL Y-2460]|uniref:F-box domain-containing protein n=1 Tax=Pachysolen tannophilus NRRL Y-2460 TaxID=669874 RepID=A0A1E4TTF1_PACTA|nr:hypothetical protein PACTADRAFT_3911 [Pachysolen tannophilus NRRL Y-2460]